MADAFQKQLDTDEAAALNFEERLGLLIDTEWTAREQRKLQRRLQTAKLRYPASLEAVDFTRARQLNCQQVLTLGTCAWIAERHNLIITGPCGIGKSFLCCALVERACRRGFNRALRPHAAPARAPPQEPTSSAPTTTGFHQAHNHVPVTDPPSRQPHLRPHAHGLGRRDDPADPPDYHTWRILTGLEQPWRSIEPLMRLYHRLS